MRPHLFLGALMAVAFTPGLATLEADVVSEVEPNQSYSQAQAIDDHFSLDYRDDIDTLHIQRPDGTWYWENTNTSQTIPHVTIDATGDGTVDFYSFTGTQGATAILDIDHSFYTVSYDLDPMIHVWFSGYGSNGGEFVAGNNDMGSSRLGVDTGSYTGTDPLLQFELPETGLYYVGVADVTAVAYSWIPAYYSNNGVKDGGIYTLHVSIEGHSVNAVPEPSALVTALSGLLAMGLVFKRRHRKKSR